MILIKQTVYLPVEEGDSEISVSYWERETHITDVKEESGYFFTPEQLNEYTANVIKKTLETAANNAKYKHNGKMYQNAEGVYYDRSGIAINKQSITNTFEETYKQFKV